MGQIKDFPRGKTSSSAVANGGEPPYDDDMKTRIEKLEEFAADAKERLVKIETLLEQSATKADMHELSSTMVKWIVGTVSGLGVAAITVMTFVLNNATPKAPSAQPLPIVIYAQPTPIASPTATTPAAPAPTDKR